MRIVFIGCVEFSHSALIRLLKIPEAEVVGVVTRNSSSFNTDFRSLLPLAKPLEIPCFIAEKNDQGAMFDFVRELNPDVIYCFGWSYLLRSEILGVPHLGIIGFHPAALPQNRGRHPLIWALALGLQQTASTFFFMDEHADSGDILSQRPIPIGPEDDAGTLYQKMTEVALEQIPVFTQALAIGTYERHSQNHAKANSWRKRSVKDGWIDWRMSAETIHNLVRALTRPYVGAHCLYQNNEIKVWKTTVEDRDGVENFEPGKVLSNSDGRISIKCGTGTIMLLEHEFHQMPSVGEYFL